MSLEGVDKIIMEEANRTARKTVHKANRAAEKYGKPGDGMAIEYISKVILGLCIGVIKTCCKEGNEDQARAWLESLIPYIDRHAQDVGLRVVAGEIMKEPVPEDETDDEMM